MKFLEEWGVPTLLLLQEENLEQRKIRRDFCRTEKQNISSGLRLCRFRAY